MIAVIGLLIGHKVRRYHAATGRVRMRCAVIMIGTWRSMIVFIFNAGGHRKWVFGLLSLPGLRPFAVG